jgi:hypothetical protein
VEEIFDRVFGGFRRAAGHGTDGFQSVGEDLQVRDMDQEMANNGRRVKMRGRCQQAVGLDGREREEPWKWRATDIALESHNVA